MFPVIREGCYIGDEPIGKATNRYGALFRLRSRRNENSAVVLGGDGEVLDVGQSVRTATPPQRKALRAMHRTCAHPGCRTVVDDCKMHHIEFFRNGGNTSINNLLPVRMRKSTAGIAFRGLGCGASFGEPGSTRPVPEGDSSCCANSRSVTGLLHGTRVPAPQ